MSCGLGLKKTTTKIYLLAYIKCSQLIYPISATRWSHSTVFMTALLEETGLRLLFQPSDVRLQMRLTSLQFLSGLGSTSKNLQTVNSIRESNFSPVEPPPYPVRSAVSSTGPPDLRAPIELPLDDQSARRGACRLCDFSRSGSLWHVVVSPNQSDCR